MSRLKEICGGVDIRLKMDDEKYEANYFSVDEHYIETMGLELIAGRNSPKNMSTESEKFVRSVEDA